ncbi:chorismate-binding protein, partial [Pseudomonas aeruginosa]
MLGDLLGVRQQILLQCQVGLFVDPARTGTGDRAHRHQAILDPYQHLRRAAHDMEVAEVEEVHVGRRIETAQRMSIEFKAAPIDLYRALRCFNPTPYMYFFNFGDFHVLGSSPEVLVRVED